MKIRTIGIDLAKETFWTPRGRRPRQGSAAHPAPRKRLLSRLMRLEPRLIGMGGLRFRPLLGSRDRAAGTDGDTDEKTEYLPMIARSSSKC